MEDITGTITDTERPTYSCWFSGRAADLVCSCGRPYVPEYGFGGHCMVCALGLGLYEKAGVPEPVSGILMFSLAAASGDPYIVVPGILQGTTPLTLPQVERLIGALLRMAAADDAKVRARAAEVLAATTNSWATMNPSALEQRKYGTSLLAIDQARRGLIGVLLQSRQRSAEPTAIAILDKLITADFRDPYPAIQGGFKQLSCSNLVTRVRSVFEAMQQFYPSYSPLVNERCELMVYEQYVNRTKGAGASMERIYSPLLKQSPLLAKMLKKGTWLSNHSRYEEWYYGEDEPV